MTQVQVNNQPHVEVVSPPIDGYWRARRRKWFRRAWAVVALLAAGFFIHDAVWHAMLVVFGMNTIVGMEFSLPDLEVYHIYPTRVARTFAFLFATVAASLLLWLGLRLGKRSLNGLASGAVMVMVYTSTALSPLKEQKQILCLYLFGCAHLHVYNWALRLRYRCLLSREAAASATHKTSFPSYHNETMISP